MPRPIQTDRIFRTNLLVAWLISLKHCHAKPFAVVMMMTIRALYGAKHYLTQNTLRRYKTKRTKKKGGGGGQKNTRIP